MAKTNQRQQHCNIADNDRISKLPDSILCHILSLLPTKDTVTTSCLSKRWRFTWTSVDVLDLSDQFFQSLHIPKRRRTSACMKSFKNFVNMVLILRSHPVVQQFKLQLNNAYEESDVHSWIFAAITHNVQELDLSMQDTVSLPRIVYSCGTIVALKLSSKIELNVPESVCLQNLKVLQLRFIPTLSDASVSRLLSGSPVLEELLIYRSHAGDDCKTFSIVSSSLKAFILKHRSYEGDHFGVLIDAPKLEILKLNYPRRQVEVEIKIENAHSVIEATFNFSSLDCHGDEKFSGVTFDLWRMKNVKVLSSPLVLLNEALIYTRNLTELTVTYCGHDLSMLPQILTKLPSLRVLKLDKVSNCHHFEVTSDAWEKERLQIGCLKKSLKRIQFKGFKMTAQEMEIVEFFVRNARGLTEVRFDSKRYRSESEKALMRKLFSFPTYSNALKMMFF